MDTLNGAAGQDGNQIVIAKNSGTIHIHNHSKDNVEVMQKLLEQERRNEDRLAESNKTFRDFFTAMKEMGDKMVDLEVKKSKKKK